MTSSRLPAFALFPIAAWRDQLPPGEWVACLDAWLALVDSHLSLSDSEFLSISTKDDSLQGFLASFTREVAVGGIGTLGSSSSAKKLMRDCLALVTRLLQSSSAPSGLVQWEFFADLSRAYGKRKARVILDSLSETSRATLDSSLSALKRFLIKNLDAGINGGDLRGIEERLERLNDLLSVSPAVAEFFLAGSDFVDGLTSCYKITNPPLRRVLIATTYLCLMGLAEGQKASALTDQLYSLKATADAHKAGPLNVNDSLVAELVTSTPLLQRLERKLAESNHTSNRTKSVLAALGAFKKPGGGMPKPKRLIRRKVDKGKGLAEFDEAQAQQEMHVHRMSQISQVQDLFPELGSGFISKLLDEYDNSTEDVIAHLLDDSLPPHLQSADRSASLPPTLPRRSSLAPRPTPPVLSPPFRAADGAEEVDEDNLDLLTASASNLHLGKRADQTADALLSRAPSTANKAAILSALAAFDSDDDERDDTYDAADVGGTVEPTTSDPTAPVNNRNGDVGPTRLAAADEATLYRAWLAQPSLFARDSATRRGAERARLRQATGLTDEAVEGWAVVLGRDAALQRRLRARYGEWSGQQAVLGSTAWRAGAGAQHGGDGGADDGGYDDDGEEGGEEEEEVEGGGEAGASGEHGGAAQSQAQAGRGGGRGRGRGGRGSGRGGRGRGGGGGAPGGPGAAPPADSAHARRRKEASKGSRANHNRRDQRARKMARGGFAG